MLIHLIHATPVTGIVYLILCLVIKSNIYFTVNEPSELVCYIIIILLLLLLLLLLFNQREILSNLFP